MGREIRRVPPGWEHPKDAKGNYEPLFDKTFADAIWCWYKEYIAWQVQPHGGYSFEEWVVPYPNPEDYRPEWIEKPAHYQIYETVTEGTPVSPIFTSLDEMHTWLIEQGCSEKVLSKFIKRGYALGTIRSRLLRRPRIWVSWPRPLRFGHERLGSRGGTG